jgi:putative ubiquitin-RnfH superfamily antitoxin RatB of RatAB toxin-antitoxin module
MAEPVTVEVVLARADEQIRRSVTLASGATAWQAVVASCLAEDFPDDVDPQRLGIFAKHVEPDAALQDGDRVEIYRGLTLDPKDARRRRARKR